MTDESFKPVITTQLWSWLRSKFSRNKKAGFPNTYLVPVYIEHPELPDHIIKQQVSISGHSRAHARVRLKRELRLRIGTARRHSTN